MILLCGIPSEPPLALVHQRLQSLGVPVQIFNQRRFADANLAFELVSGEVSGRLELEEQLYRLEDFEGVYTRLMDHEVLPELRGEPVDSPKRRHCASVHEALTHWLEISPARVVNRCVPMGSNFSKPYQAQLIRQHRFSIPETLTTNKPELVHEFHARHGRVVYKSISGVRSIVKLLE